VSIEASVEAVAISEPTLSARSCLPLREVFSLCIDIIKAAIQDPSGRVTVVNFNTE
jgi:hypothetical protein